MNACGHFCQAKESAKSNLPTPRRKNGLCIHTTGEKESIVWK